MYTTCQSRPIDVYRLPGPERTFHVHLYVYSVLWLQTSNVVSLLRTIADRSDGEKTPPEAVHEAPRVARVILLREVHEAGEGEHRHEDEHQQQAKFPRSLQTKIPCGSGGTCMCVNQPTTFYILSFITCRMVKKRLCNPAKWRTSLNTRSTLVTRTRRITWRRKLYTRVHFLLAKPRRRRRKSRLPFLPSL